jgi:hypothetical protein
MHDNGTSKSDTVPEQQFDGAMSAGPQSGRRGSSVRTCGVEAVLRDADRALCEAKQNGRNQVRLAPGLQVQALPPRSTRYEKPGVSINSCFSV